MKTSSRRKWLTAGLGATAATAGLAAAVKVADANGLLAPDAKGFYGPGEGLNYAAYRLLSRGAAAREFSREQISNPPFAIGKLPKDEVFQRHLKEEFVNWKLELKGMVARPTTFSVAELKAEPSRSQITQLVCEEGWSYIAEWIGVPLSHLLEKAGVDKQAKYVVYFSHQAHQWNSLDMDEAMHPQTLVAYGMNGGAMPLRNGAPLRMRVPRQLGYKSVKYLNGLVVTDRLDKFGKGLGAAAPEHGYAWYAGI